MSKIFLLFLWLFVLGLLHKSVVLGCMNAHYVYKRYKSKNFYSYSLKFKRSGVLSEVHYKNYALWILLSKTADWVEQQNCIRQKQFETISWVFSRPYTVFNLQYRSAIWRQALKSITIVVHTQLSTLISLLRVNNECQTCLGALRLHCCSTFML